MLCVGDLDLSQDSVYTMSTVFGDCHFIASAIIILAPGFQREKLRLEVGERRDGGVYAKEIC